MHILSDKPKSFLWLNLDYWLSDTWGEKFNWFWYQYWERWRAEGEEGMRGWDGQMASLMKWTWTCATSGDGEGGTGRLGMLQSMGSQRVGHNWETEQKQPILKKENASTFSEKLQQPFLIKMEAWLKFENKSLKPSLHWKTKDDRSTILWIGVTTHFFKALFLRAVLGSHSFRFTSKVSRKFRVPRYSKPCHMHDLSHPSPSRVLHSLQWTYTDTWLSHKVYIRTCSWYYIFYGFWQMDPAL